MYLVRDAAGNPVHKVGVIMDVSEIKQAEDDLRATASRLKAILEHAPVGIVTANLQNRFEETQSRIPTDDPRRSPKSGHVGSLQNRPC